MAVALALLGAFVLVEASQLKMTSLGGGPGPGVFPVALGVILLGIGARLAPAALRERTEFGHLRRVAVLIGALAAYAALLDRLGFVITTSATIVFLLVAFNPRRRLWLAALGLAGSVGSYALFSSFLKVQLPPDPWFLWP
ncbi:MAG: hypothetical protein AUI58_05865 [Chloroflexi bacterium 13_1_40CM_2_70_6]|nr:MAG: hypothetical protein AUI58_05865 [Chloroflexi bacterium 13_1_40CM_2_70_6]